MGSRACIQLVRPHPGETVKQILQWNPEQRLPLADVLHKCPHLRPPGHGTHCAISPSGATESVASRSPPVCGTSSASAMEPSSTRSASAAEAGFAVQDQGARQVCKCSGNCSRSCAARVSGRRCQRPVPPGRERCLHCDCSVPDCKAPRYRGLYCKAHVSQGDLPQTVQLTMLLRDVLPDIIPGDIVVLRQVGAQSWDMVQMLVGFLLEEPTAVRCWAQERAKLPSNYTAMDFTEAPAFSARNKNGTPHCAGDLSRRAVQRSIAETSSLSWAIVSAHVRHARPFTRRTWTTLRKPTPQRWAT